MEKYASLVNELLVSGYQVVLLGSPNDVKDSEMIVQNISVSAKDALKNLTGKTSIPEVIDIIALAQAAVTNDSGLMHVAAATGCSTIALFGPSSPLHTPPLSKKAVILESASGNMSDISVDDVFDALSNRIQLTV